MKIRHFVIGFATILVFLLSTSAFAHTDSGARVELSPNNPSPAVGETVAIKILLDTAQNPVNAAQVNLSYPAAKLTFVNIDSTQSQFTLQAEGKEEGGIVKIARGSTQPLTGEEVVFASVLFSVKDASGINEVSVSPESMIVRSTDHNNILVNGGNITPIDDSSSAASGIAGFVRGIFAGITSVFSGIFGIFTR